MNENVIKFKLSESSEAKVKKCLETKIVYVKSISWIQLNALNSKGFTVILK